MSTELRKTFETYKRQPVRHFPILMDKQPTIGNLVGILTSTDFFRIWLEEFNTPQSEKTLVKESHLTLIMSHKISRAKYKKMFESFSCVVHSEGEYEKLIDGAQMMNMVVVFDLDDDYGAEGATLMTKAIATGSHVVFLTNRLKLASEFKKRLRNPKHHIMIKPIDISFLKFLISENHKTDSEAS